MNENQAKQDNLLDTTDCLEAVGVFRGWKNGLFVVVILCLLLLQISFWLVDTGCVKAKSKTEAVQTTLPMIEPPPLEVWPPPAKDLVVPLQKGKTKQSVGKPVKIEKAAKELVAEPNKPPEEPQRQTGFPYGLTFGHLSWTVRFVNGLLIISAVLYCLSMLFSLKVSLIGRLGGINHISRAFFLSLIALVLLLPWQKLFAGVVAGAMYSPKELLSSYAASKLPPPGIFSIALYYLRFTGYWLLVVLLLILSQMRSSRWTKAVLRRLEVI